MEPAGEPIELLPAFARTSDGVFAVDQNRRVVYCNPAAERILGANQNALLGRLCDEIIEGLDSSGDPVCGPDCGIMGCVQRGHAPQTQDLMRTNAQGRRQWLNVSIVVLPGRAHRSTLSVHLLRDVTERRAIEQRAADLLSRLPVQDGAAKARPNITRREADVLRLLACGASNGSIAETLGITPTTVRNHIEHLLTKLGAHSRLEAVIVAARSGLV